MFPISYGHVEICESLRRELFHFWQSERLWSSDFKGIWDYFWRENSDNTWSNKIFILIAFYLLPPNLLPLKFVVRLKH